MKIKFFTLTVCAILLSLTIASAAHFIVGFVNDGNDGTSANDLEVVLWNPVNGIADNVTDTVGSNGNSGTDNIYLIDCELLNTPCQVGDELRIDLIDANNYSADFVNLTVSGAGFDVAPNITLDSPPALVSLLVDDNVSFPFGEIDLEPFATKQVICEGVIQEYDNQTITNVSAEFFESATSFYGDNDDNNHHYTNTTCSLNTTYGSDNESYFECGFDVAYYANAGSWECSVLVLDSTSNVSFSNSTTINSLLAISVPDFIDYGSLNATDVSEEMVFNITNAGNSLINLSLSAYGSSPGDGFAMDCTSGGGIPVYYEKYNLTASNAGTLNLSELDSLYTNLSSDPVIEEFNLLYRTNDTDLYTDEINDTYWRMYLPAGFGGSCSGTIVVGAVQMPAS